jgi:hypothetical protein
MYSSHVVASSSVPRSERETPLLVDFVTYLPHVVSPVLPSRRLPLDFAARPPRVALVFCALAHSAG